LKVALDFRSVPSTGLWNYSTQLMAGLQGKGVDVRRIQLPEPLIRASSLAYVQGLQRLAWENTAMPMNFMRKSIGLFHCTNNYGIPFFMPCPSVLTVHDFVPLILRDTYWPQHKKRLAYQTFLNHALRSATRIIAISDFTRDALLQRFPAAAGKVRRVYHGCGKQYRRVEDSAAIERTLQKLKLPHEYVLTMGGTEPRKNVASVVELFRERWNQGQKTPTLAIVGDIWRGHEVKPWNLTPNIVFLGSVAEEELIHLYNRCLLFVFPSLLEGFGLPLLEAMGCGAPVLAMRASSVPEVTGDAAILVEPGSLKELAQAVERLLRDSSLRSELAKRGRERASGFTWEKAATETLEVYQEAMADI